MAGVCTRYVTKSLNPIRQLRVRRIATPWPFLLSLLLLMGIVACVPIQPVPPAASTPPPRSQSAVVREEAPDSHAHDIADQGGFRDAVPPYELLQDFGVRPTVEPRPCLLPHPNCR